MDKNIERLYISVDLEGTEGIVSRLQTTRGHGDYELARRRLTLDVNAAVRAAADFGTKEIIVSDGHADMENILIDDLDPAADLISGSMRPSSQMPLIQEGFDAAIVFGHAGGGLSYGGVLDHTFNDGRIYEMYINDTLINTEAVFAGMVAGHYDTPLIAIVGDAAVVSQVQSFIPGCEGIIVKRGITRLSALSVNPVRVRQMIYEGVGRALRRAGEIAVFSLPEPLTLKLIYQRANSADIAAMIPGVKRISPRGISFTGSAEEVFALHALLMSKTLDEYPIGY